MQLTSSIGKRVITPPSTPVEIEVSKIWEDLLKVKDISIHDSFLELGGHSLLASIMLQRLNHTFNINLSLMDILTNGLTIVELVSLIEERVVEEASEEDIESVLGMLEGLSDDEIKELLKKAGL
ncbi:Linear gramicidin synthase subunit B [compost metagenome]